MRKNHGLFVSTEYKTLKEDMVVVIDEKSGHRVTIAGEKKPDGTLDVTRWTTAEDEQGGPPMKDERWHRLEKPVTIDFQDGGVIRRLMDQLVNHPGKKEAKNAFVAPDVVFDAAVVDRISPPTKTPVLGRAELAAVISGKTPIARS
jgi:hypothetical protein